MPVPSDLPIVDHHCHLSPGGEGVAAVRRFAAAGGTHLFLATQNYAGDAPVDLDGYRAQYAMTEQLARTAEAEARVITYPVLAPYPIDLLAQAERIGLDRAVALQSSALDLAGHEVEEGRAVALGEVGRPHFPTDPKLAMAIEATLVHALEVGRDVGCPVVLHAEELDADGFRSLSELAARTSFPVQRLVKHYHRTVLAPGAFHGLVPSYLAKRELVREALPTPEPWFLETDFLDDPRRPGAVLDLATVPRRVDALFAADPSVVERLRVPFERSVRAVYGFTPETGRAR